MMSTTLNPPTTVASPVADVICHMASEPARVESLHAILGDFCHLVRNRLNSLQIGLYLAKSGSENTGTPSWGLAESYCRDAEHVIELFQTVCRPMPLRTISIGLDLVLRDIVNRWQSRFLARGLTLTMRDLSIAEPSRIDPSRIAQTFDALAAWRVEEAEPGSSITLRGRAAQGWSQVEWIEDASSLDTTRGALCLGALARVASAHGGKLARRDTPSLSLTIDWPNRESSSREMTSA